MSADDGSYWDLIGPAWDDLCTGLDSPEAWQAAQARHQRPVVLLFAAHYCQSEVCNGGWSQFFYNSTGVLGPEACEGFEALGMTNLARISRSALALLGNTYPRNRGVRERYLQCGTPLRTGAKPDSVIVSNASVTADAVPETSQRPTLNRKPDPLGLNALNKQFYSNIDSELGGFDIAVSTYANRSPTSHSRTTETL